MRRKDMDKIAIIMGSISDKEIMDNAAEILKEMDISYEMKVLSAHRTPELLHEYISYMEKNDFKVVIAGAGGAAHLAGVIASGTLLPVIGVPIETKALGGLDSLLSTVQMPGGIPVATVGIGNAKNARTYSLLAKYSIIFCAFVPDPEANNAIFLILILYYLLGVVIIVL